MPGKTGAKAGRVHDKTILKIMIAIRVELQNLGLTDAQIAEHIGISYPSYIRLKNLKLYRRVRTQYMTGIVAPLDTEIQNTYSFQRKILESGVPTALENLVALAAQKVDKKLQFEASKELLDRHGMHAKVSRQGLALPEQGGVASVEDNEIAAALLKNLNKAKKAQEVEKEKENEVSVIEATESEPPSLSNAPITDIVQ